MIYWGQEHFPLSFSTNRGCKVSTQSDTVGEPSHPQAVKAAKWEIRVLATAGSSNQAKTRTMLIAVAHARCWRWVLARPSYRLRRIPNARTPCDIVASIPARL